MPEKLSENMMQLTSTDFELFFRMSVDAMLIINSDGILLDCNLAYEKITGYKKADLIKMDSGWGVIHEDDVARVMDQLSKINSGESNVIDFEIRIKTRTGGIKIVSFDSSIDKVKGLIYTIGRDVTELRHQQNYFDQSEFRLQFFFDHALDGMSIIVDGKYHLVNKAFLNIFGYESEKEIIGKDFIDFIDPEVREKVVNILENHSTQLYNSKIIRKDGSLRNVEITGRTVVYQNQLVRISVWRDLDERKKLQDRINESEERFKAVFQNSSLGILLADYNGNIIDANHTVIERLGFTESEFKKMNLVDIVYDDSRGTAINTFSELIKGAVARTYTEKKLKKKNGNLTWSRITCNLMRVSESQKLVLALIEDIDTQKRSEKALIESEEKFRAVYESSPMGILITKAPGIIYDLNPAFAEMMGYTEDELKGKNLLDITHPSDYQKTKKWLEKIYSKEIYNYISEKRYLRKDGTEFWAKAVVSTMNDISDEVTTVSIVENIERKKRTEDALEQKNRELTQINQELEHFAYVASHDLQEPLRTITSFIQILERRYIKKLDEDAGQFMSYVVEGAKRMQTLIHDLLEYSRINRFNTGYEKVDLNEIFNTINRVLKDKIESNDALILAENLPTVYGSRLQLTQVFQNLVDNAIKFRAKKRKPEIIISVNDIGDKWELTFKDNGIGISQEYFQRIFVIFQRLHTPDEYTGTGIGLAICKKIIERHGGEIWVNSKAEKGSEFHFTIAKNIMVPIG
ncbi:MAG: PAS domain S-box protein [Chitinophagales bacterium]